ncbi:MAG: cell division protein FtsA [Spirochaetales bacterium]|nr:cell division protein FtsA [Spirochaetales bacterium]
MPYNDLIVGLDIGTSKVCAVIGQYDENNIPEITGVGMYQSRGMRRGVIVNIDATVKSIVQAVEAAEMMAGREVGEVTVGISGAHVEGINSRGVVAVTGKGREIVEADVERVIDAARAIVVPMDRAILHVIPQEFIVDDQSGIKNPVGMIGVRLESEVHIITGSTSSAQNIIKSVNRAGFRVSEIVLESLAASKAVLSQDEKDLGVLLIDLGGGTTNVLVYIEGAPYHTSILSLGADQVTSDLSIMLKTPLESAERIKRDAGCCYVEHVEDDHYVQIPRVGGRPPDRIAKSKIAEIIQPRMEEILRLVRDRVNEQQLLKRCGGGVVIVGGGALMPGVAELATDIFELPVRIGYPEGPGGLKEEYSDPQYATAVGLVMSAAGKSEGEAPRRERKERGQNILSKFKEWIGEFF